MCKITALNKLLSSVIFVILIIGKLNNSGYTIKNEIEDMSVLVNFAIFPTDVGTSVSSKISNVIKSVIDSGFDYKLNAMGTVFETKTMEQALAVIQNAYNVLEDHERIYLVINMDIQRKKDNRINSKVESIERKLGKVEQ